MTCLFKLVLPGLRRLLFKITKMARYIGIMYKLKHVLPLKVRIHIFQSMVQSHLNYCSLFLVWGFSAKSNIKLIFRNQKKATRAVMPGYVNYFYKEGKIPTHTNESFYKYKILTIHGLIVKNVLIFMHKVNHFPELLPKSIYETIPEKVPTSYSIHENSRVWLKRYGQGVRTF